MVDFKIYVYMASINVTKALRLCFYKSRYMLDFQKERHLTKLYRKVEAKENGKKGILVDCKQKKASTVILIGGKTIPGKNSIKRNKEAHFI